MKKPESADEYLAEVPADQRSALEHLRATIKAVVPEANEVISYGVPMFKQKKGIVSYGAGKNHCAFYVQSPAVMEAHKDELAGYDTATSTIRFAPDKPLPEELVKKLVLARVAENETRRR